MATSMTPRLTEALLKVRADIPTIQKDAIHLGNKYVFLESLMPNVLPMLHNHGILLMQSPSSIDGAPALRTTLVHVASEESIEETTPLSVDGSAAEVSSTETRYARRRAIMSLISLAEPLGQGGPRQLLDREG
jgi:hypothetical protein